MKHVDLGDVHRSALLLVRLSFFFSWPPRLRFVETSVTGAVMSLNVLW